MYCNRVYDGSSGGSGTCSLRSLENTMTRGPSYPIFLLWILFLSFISHQTNNLSCNSQQTKKTFLYLFLANYEVIHMTCDVLVALIFHRAEQPLMQL